MADRPLYVPVVLGTVRRGAKSAPFARFLVEETAKRPGVETEMLDLGGFRFKMDDAGQAAADPEFTSRMARMDALILVAPEYNHGFPGMLKHALDTCLEEYIHKPVGVAGVSAGAFGGTRGIQDLLPVLRELGLVTIFWDLNLTHSYRQIDDDGRLKDPAPLGPHLEKFLNELVWMAKVLRHGREQVPQE
jgi:NAD(P)H-dependent FMN reductase